MKSIEQHWAGLFGYAKEDTNEKKDANLRTVFFFLSVLLSYIRMWCLNLC